MKPVSKYNIWYINKINFYYLLILCGKKKKYFVFLE
jgi:hypothetical protein